MEMLGDRKDLTGDQNGSLFLMLESPHERCLDPCFEVWNRMAGHPPHNHAMAGDAWLTGIRLAPVSIAVGEVHKKMPDNMHVRHWQ